MEEATGILIYKHPVPIAGVRHKGHSIIYVVAPRPEFPKGFTTEFEDN